MEQQLISLICLFVGLLTGYIIGSKPYRDMRDFAHTYGNLSVQLVNKLQSLPFPAEYKREETIEDLVNRNGRQQEEDEMNPDFALIAGSLDPE